MRDKLSGSEIYQEDYKEISQKLKVFYRKLLKKADDLDLKKETKDEKKKKEPVFKISKKGCNWNWKRQR